MRLTTFSDYTIRMLIHVATAPGGRATIAEVARAFAISEGHLVKIAHVLGREGILLNTRGRGGGLQLARPAREINIGRVLRMTEGGDFPAECFRPGNRCALTPVCRLSGVLEQAVEAFYAVLDRFTLADLIVDRAPVAAILHFHAAR